MKQQEPLIGLTVRITRIVLFGVLLLLSLSRAGGAEQKGVSDIIKLFSSPGQPIFALTEEKNGLFTSADNGRRWKQVTLPEDLILYDLTADRHGRLFLSTDKGIYKSGNHGKSWQQAGKEPAAFITFSRKKDDYLLKIWGKGLFRYTAVASSTDNKLKRCRGLPDSPVQTALFGPGEIPYAGFFGKGVYHLPSGSNTWVPVNAGLENKNILLLARSPDGMLWAGTYGGGLYKWNADNTSWKRLDLGISPVVVQSLVFGGSNELFAGTLKHGILFSPDRGETWVQKGAGLGRDSIQGLTVSANGNLFAGVYGKGMFQFDRENNGWQEKPFAYTANIYRIDLTPQGVLYAGSKGLGDLFTSKDQGKSWNRVAVPFSTSDPVTFITDNEKLIVGTRSDGPFISSDAGKSWQLLAAGLPKEQDEELKSIRALEKDENGSIYSVQASGKGIYRLSEDLVWERVAALGEQCREYYDSDSMQTSGLLFFPDRSGLIWDSYTTIVVRNNFTSWNCTRFGQNLEAHFVDASTTVWNNRMLSTFVQPVNKAEWSKAPSAHPVLYRRFQHVKGNGYLGISRGNGLDVLLWNGSRLQLQKRVLTDQKVLSVAAGVDGFFAGTEGGIWHSVDNGETWKEVVLIRTLIAGH